MLAWWVGDCFIYFIRRKFYLLTSDKKVFEEKLRTLRSMMGGYVRYVIAIWIGVREKPA